MCTHIMYVRKSIVRVHYVRAHHVPAQHVRAHHVRVQEQLVASAPDQYADSAGPARCEGAHLYADQ